MNKLSKLTALLLAIVLALGVPLGAMAESEEITTKSQYIEVADEILEYMIENQISWDDYTTLTDVIAETDYADFYARLTDDEKEKLESIVISLFWDACITYDKYAPFLPAVLTPATAEASAFSLLSRAGEDTTTDESEMNTDALVVNKTSENNGDGTYTITMETYTTGDVEVKKTFTPVDVVLVLDYTGSMTEDLNSSPTVSRIEALKNAITGTAIGNLSATTGFTDIFAKSNDDYMKETGETQGINRLSIFTYNQTMSESGVTDLLGGWVYLDSSMLNEVDGVAGVEDKVNDAPTPGGGTPTGYAMQRALTQMTTNYGTFTEARKKVVILFTDGVPGTKKDNEYYFDSEDAARAVNAAATLKGDTVGATVYTIVVYPNASPEGTYDFSSQTTDVIRINTMLHAISSNFPSATATAGTDRNVTYNNTSDGDATKGYYKSAGNAAALQEIFANLAKETASGSANIKLDSSTVIKDVMSPYFVLPDGVTAADVTVQSYKCTSYDEDTKEAVFYDTPDTAYDATQNYQVTLTGDNTVSVTGFDFNANYVAQTGRDETDSTKEGDFHGRKLVISFDVVATEGFLGGNDVVTNDPSSGVYRPVTDESGNTTLESVKPYPVPDVDVELWEIQVIGKHQHIFLSNEADMNALLQSFSLQYTKEGFPDETYEVDGIRNDYATIKFSLTAKSGEAMVYTIEPGATVGTWTYVNTETGDPIENFDVTPFLTGDEDGVADGTIEYTISYEVIPENEGTYKKTTGSLDVGVHVYKPTFTFQDTTEDYLATVNTPYYDTKNFFSESWSHTYYDEITVTINVTYDANGTPSYSYVATDKNNKEIASDSDWDMKEETINFSGYESTADIDYQVKMSGPKPDVVFTYSPLEETWIQDGKVTAVECVPVDVTKVTLTSTNTHDKVEQVEGGALTEGEYKTESVYTEGSDTASVTITKIEENSTAVNGDPVKKDVTGIPHIKTLRNELDCNCSYDAKEGGVTDIHANAPETDAVPEFVVHITNVMGSLTISKTVTGDGASADDTFLFTITGPGIPGIPGQMQVILKGGEHVTINNLLVGDYVVKEETGWSWRYTCTESDATLEAKVEGNETATVEFSNTLTTQTWLDGNAHADNNFTGTTTTTEGGGSDEAK